ncbi:MAG: hypothetical protein Q8N95_05705 [Desulfobacterales bacterium]|nr:hypothetical protein [Desulfobacterales bacterium]
MGEALYIQILQSEYLCYKKTSSLFCYRAVREPGISISEFSGRLELSLAGVNQSVKRGEKYKGKYYMGWITKTFKIWAPLLVLFTCLVLAGCEGTDSREKVDDTVKELSGQKNRERMDQMKKDIGKINKQQADRLKEPE